MNSNINTINEKKFRYALSSLQDLWIQELLQHKKALTKYEDKFTYQKQPFCFCKVISGMHTCPSYFAKNSCKPEPCNVSSSGKSSKNAGGNAAAIFSVEIERYQKSADCRYSWLWASYNLLLECKCPSARHLWPWTSCSVTQKWAPLLLLRLQPT